MDLAKILCLVVLILGISSVESRYMVYNTSHTIVPGKLNVHVVPHSHDDVGWLKTVDQYYVGSNNSIQVACVQNVLDSLVPALLADKNRKFIYVEQAFFQRWWREQSEEIKRIVKELIRSGQLELINGGMCMHDEAAPHYIDMIDQTTLGHRFIVREFNVTPRIGWQIDPFGHSAVQAYLLGAEVGFDSVFFGRIDYQDREKRFKDKTLEVIWRGSKSFGSSSQIFAGAFPKNYEPPPGGFYYEIIDDSPVVQDDPDLFDYNVQERVNAFVAAALDQANITRTNHIMFTMGTDFRYQYAHTWFRQMDKLLHYVNLDGRVNVLYSTPSIYTDAKHAANEAWPLKTEDYFPYADRINGYWTGYFTSRPALKRYVRVMSAYYLAARQLEFFKGRSEKGPNTDLLADALAIAQHHDAVSGTSKQHVANDYAKRLAMGYVEAESVVATSFAHLTKVDPALKPTFQQCLLLNISYCPASEINISDGKSLVVLAYNPLGWKRVDIVRLPVVDGDIAVHDSEGHEVESQLIPFTDEYVALRNYHVEAYLGQSPTQVPKYWLVFSVSVPPLGFTTYTVSTAKKTGGYSSKSYVSRFQKSEPSVFGVGHGHLKLSFSTDQGTAINYSNSRTLMTEPLKQTYSYYSGYNGTNDKEPQNSGAYVFRPNDTYPINPEGQVPLTVIRGPLVDEVHQQINPWISQVTRVYKGKEHVEVEFIVGSIPIGDGIGKEVVTQISSSLKSNKTFYTDSSGRDYIKRIRDYRSDWNLEVNQPVAGNYYPINHGIYLQDSEKEFSVMVDRSFGGSSIVDGQVELMLHRRLLLDDSRGVAEALNETVCVQHKCTGLTIQGKYYYRIDPYGEGAKWRRTFGQEIYSPLLLAFAEQDDGKPMTFGAASFSGFDSSYSLPDNVALLTLQELDDGNVLLRLAHLFEVGEDKELSGVASVQLKKLFPGKKIAKVTEMSLSANQERSAMEKKRLVWKVEGEGSNGEEKTAKRGKGIDPRKLEMELYPMEIRTVLIRLEHPPSHSHIYRFDA
uniref:Alpha-mannosidase n=1 Tax=Noccaea caerulescens TaxID=107243 RepID=A0A1J3IV57_NOCCA